MTRRDFLIGSATLALAGRRAFAIPTSTLERLASLARTESWRTLPIGDLIGRVGIELVGTPYVANTLEVNQKETCVVNLEELDCVTFYETCLAIARAIKRGSLDRSGLVLQLTEMRYRDGRLNGYASRLHYTTDWFYDNARRGLVKLIAADLPGAAAFKKRIDFMSTHPESYRQLKADKSHVARIAATEKEMAARSVYYLPKSAIGGAEDRLRTGDIVGITTSIDGLDCSHTGLCYRQGRLLRFLHASSRERKVVLDVRLADYLAASPKSTGVILARPVLQ